MNMFFASQKGQSIIELMIALAIFVLGSTVVTFVVIDAYIADRVGQERTQATMLAEEGIEAVRSIRDVDFDNLTADTYGLAVSGGKWVFSGSSDITDSKFTRQITITDLDVDRKKIESQVTWEISAARTGSVILIDYSTDWQQTHGDGGELDINTDNAVFGGGNKRLEGITLENVGTSDITIAKMTLQWSNSNLIEEIKIDGNRVWKYNNEGSPDGKQPSGTELDIVDFLAGTGAGTFNIDRITFDNSMSGATFIILFTMSDNSTKYVLVEPGAGPPAGNQADDLVVDTTSVDLDVGDNTKVIGITMENSGASDIVIDKMTVSWTGGTSGNKIQEITIDGGSRWSGNSNSGTELDITDFTLVSEAGTYPIDSLDFKKNMTGSTIEIIFTMIDASTKTVSNIQP